jgi:hypothetical protein
MASKSRGLFHIFSRSSGSNSKKPPALTGREGQASQVQPTHDSVATTAAAVGHSNSLAPSSPPSTAANTRGPVNDSIALSTESYVQMESEVPSTECTPEIGRQLSETLVVADNLNVPMKKTTRSLLELNEVLADFQQNYEKFAASNCQYFVIGEDFQGLARITQPGSDIRQSAKIFGERARTVLETLERKKKLSANKWSTRIANFLTKLYPVAKLSCGFVGAVAEVRGPICMANKRTQPSHR